MGKFVGRFDDVVLLSAPIGVMLDRVRHRTNNPYGKQDAEIAQIKENVRRFQPRLKRIASHEVQDRHQPSNPRCARNNPEAAVESGRRDSELHAKALQHFQNRVVAWLGSRRQRLVEALAAKAGAFGNRRSCPGPWPHGRPPRGRRPGSGPPALPSGTPPRPRRHRERRSDRTRSLEPSALPSVEFRHHEPGALDVPLLTRLVAAAQQQQRATALREVDPVARARHARAFHGCHRPRSWCRRGCPGAPIPSAPGFGLWPWHRGARLNHLAKVSVCLKWYTNGTVSFRIQRSTAGAVASAHTLPMPRAAAGRRRCTSGSGTGLADAALEHHHHPGGEVAHHRQPRD